MAITYLHYSTLPKIHDLHNIFTELYYIPLLLGALAFGLKGAVYSFIFVTALYAPYVIINWSGTNLFIANKLLHALFSGLFAILAGALIDKEKNYREKTEKDHYLASLGRASAAIVHDLRSPLVSIAGFAKRIHEDKGNIREGSQYILNSAQKMQLILSDVLDFAKKIKLEISKEDVRDVIHHACESCKMKAEAKEVDLSISLPLDKLIISSDKLKIERALVNLINNAIDASLIGSTVSIVAESGKEFLSIRIKDSGIGMDKETLQNIFIPFYTKKSSGTGLGMAIAKKLIEEHKGKIHIKSHKQMGTEIIVELPF
jgi:signal transduction histidine kinase